tara:strand:+ start:161 stop:451 length:291 start_codon:yes stop_codon:yes gene_type:complete
MGLIESVTEFTKVKKTEEKTPIKKQQQSIASQIRGDMNNSVARTNGVPQKLTVHDTDFLMKLFLRSSIQGNEIEQAHAVFQKLKALHKGNIEDDES